MFKTLLIKESWLLFSLISFFYFVASMTTSDVRIHFGYLVTILILVIFYRTRDEPILLNENVFISPCGGKIKEIIQDKTRTIIRVFLNIQDQHAQFYPVSGTIIDVKYIHGTFHPAYMLKKTMYNERTITSIQTENADIIKVTQIAGQVARRIVNHAKIGSHVQQGDYIGMIKFSSAVDIEFSSNEWELNVKVGEKLTPIKTIIATKK